MTTIEKFYFTHKEAAPQIAVGADATDCHIEFIPEGVEGIGIRIVVRGRDNFRGVIRQIYDMGMTIVDGMPDKKNAVASTPED